MIQVSKQDGRKLKKREAEILERLANEHEVRPSPMMSATRFSFINHGNAAGQPRPSEPASARKHENRGRAAAKLTREAKNSSPRPLRACDKIT